MVSFTKARLAFSVLGIASIAKAQTGTTTSTAAAATWTINVGRLDHKMDPDIVTADIGDTILFQFYPQNHSVVRAAYRYPCVPYEYNFPGEQGWWSGFKPVDTVLANPPTASFVVNDTEPFFFYCSARGSCRNYQMIGVINPNASTSLVEQKRLAGEAQFALSPGEPIPDEDPGAPTTSSSSASTTSTSTSSAAAATTSSAPIGQSHGSSFPPSAIAGIVVGGVAIIGLAAALFYFVGRHRSMKVREAAGIIGDKSPYGTNGAGSPAPGEPLVGPGGMIYVPVKPMDYSRMSIPGLTTQPSTNPHLSTGSIHNIGGHSLEYVAHTRDHSRH